MEKKPLIDNAARSATMDSQLFDLEPRGAVYVKQSTKGWCFECCCFSCSNEYSKQDFSF